MIDTQAKGWRFQRKLQYLSNRRALWWAELSWNYQQKVSMISEIKLQQYGFEMTIGRPWEWVCGNSKSMWANICMSFDRERYKENPLSAWVFFGCWLILWRKLSPQKFYGLNKIHELGALYVTKILKNSKISRLTILNQIAITCQNFLSISFEY